MQRAVEKQQIESNRESDAVQLGTHTELAHQRLQVRSMDSMLAVKRSQDIMDDSTGSEHSQVAFWQPTPALHLRALDMSDSG